MTRVPLVRKDLIGARSGPGDGGEMAVGGATGSQDDVDAAKSALRARILADRRALDPAALTAAADTIRVHALTALAALPVQVSGPARTVALYVSTGTEPGTRPLLEALRTAGTRVLLPALRADLDLDWGTYAGPDALVPGPRGTVEPAGPNTAALAEADVVLVPGLAADRAGHRLGRGGGSYDRALRAAHPAARVAVVLHAGELLESVPAAAHDAPVDAVLTPAGWTRVGAAGETP